MGTSDRPSQPLPTREYKEVPSEAPTGRYDRSREERIERAPDPHDTMMEDMGELAELRERALERIGDLLAERYELRNILGAGAAGAVYAAYDRVRDQRVAIKLLHEGLDTAPEYVARFAREARAMSFVGHPSIAQVLDVGRDSGRGLFMVLELLEGKSLFYTIYEDELSVADVLEIGWELLDALAAAHARGIIHRDVKPENVFVVREPKGALRVKLLDFGIAKILRAENTATFNTQEGLLIGTPHYMSPEVCAGAPASVAGDLWAAAAVLYHTLAKRPPHDNEHIGRLILQIVQTEPPSIAQFRPDLPAGLVQTLDRALSRDPAKRWPTAEAFRDALERSTASS